MLFLSESRGENIAVASKTWLIILKTEQALETQASAYETYLIMLQCVFPVAALISTVHLQLRDLFVDRSITVELKQKISCTEYNSNHKVSLVFIKITIKCGDVVLSQ